MSSEVQTGYFPSVHANGKPRISGSGQPVRELRLRCIRDGMVRHFIDDGTGSDGGPNQARQAMTRKMTDKDEDGDPLFFVDDPIDFTIRHHGIVVSPHVADQRLVEKMRRNIEARSARARSSIQEALNKVAHRKADTDAAELALEQQAAALDAHDATVLPASMRPKGKPGPKPKADNGQA